MAMAAATRKSRIPREDGRRDELAKSIMATQERMEAVRGNFNTLWQSVSEHVNPNYSDFTNKHWEGQRRTNRIFDSTAPLALSHGCAALESMLCPASTRWHSLRPADPDLWSDVEIMQWLDKVTDVMFRMRYSPTANFQSQVEEAFSQLLSFGCGPFLVDDVVGYGLRYRARSLCNVYGIENAVGIIDWVHDKYEMSASAAVGAVKSGMFDTLPQSIVSAAEKEPNRMFEFIHSIKPDQDAKPGAKRFKSCIVSSEGQKTVCEYGYHTQSLLLPRYRVVPTETYGRGPGVDVLPEILMLNEMRKTYLRQGQRAISPPLLMAGDGLDSFDLRANALNPASMTVDGKPLVMPFNPGGNFEVSKEMLDEARQTVQRAFLVDIFSVMTQPQPGVTATEILQRAQEKGQLLAPICGRIQAELFGPMITREFDILHRAGQFPPPPTKVLKMGGMRLEPVYESQIQIAQKQSKALAVGLVFQQAAPLIQADPGVLKAINMDRTFKNLVEYNGAPYDMLNTPDELAAKDQAQAQQQQLTNLAQIADPMSQAIKNLSQANQAASNPTPGNALGGQ